MFNKWYYLISRLNYSTLCPIIFQIRFRDFNCVTIIWPTLKLVWNAICMKLLRIQTAGRSHKLSDQLQLMFFFYGKILPFECHKPHYSISSRFRTGALLENWLFDIVISDAVLPLKCTLCREQCHPLCVNLN